MSSPPYASERWLRYVRARGRDMEYSPYYRDPSFDISFDPSRGYEQGYRLPHREDHEDMRKWHPVTIAKRRGPLIDEALMLASMRRLGAASRKPTRRV